VYGGGLQARNGETLAADEIVWVTQAGGASWLSETGLALDGEGFIRVRDTLQSETDPLIFAAGDCASMPGRPLEKAGVFAVRMGTPLAENLRRAVLRRPLLAYRPQRRWLALISTGDRHAVASRGGLFARGDWVWRWKDWIDRRFMRRFNALEPMVEPAATAAEAVPLDEHEQTQAISAVAMRCGGCGAKVGATVLSAALANVRPIERDDVLIGLHAPDDAAVLRVPPGSALVHTVDFFRAFIDDPWLLGRIAANHALGDIFAMGGVPQSATAIATVPPGLERKVEDTVFQMMAGAVAVLNEAGCALVGGHTGEGSELALGFAVNGLIDERLDGVLRKGGMRPGDALILTKPIGTGTLLAAHARLKARGRWIDAALASMQQSNRLAVPCLVAHGATACTDLTGFGLLGHLIEMTRPSGVDAEIDLAALPLLDGAAETAAAGILSSLQPANVRLRRALRAPPEALRHPTYPLLFDPQTAGGLLASVPAENAEACVAALRRLGYASAACIGRVLQAGEAMEPICLRI
jgi:selenide,water dikinase